MTLENRGIETKKFQRCYELQRKCTLTAIFFLFSAYCTIATYFRTFIAIVAFRLMTGHASKQYFRSSVYHAIDC